MTFFLSYCILNPIIFVIFMIKHLYVEEKSLVMKIYYILNLISSFIIVFFCWLYNE